MAGDSGSGTHRPDGVAVPGTGLVSAWRGREQREWRESRRAWGGVCVMCERLFI